MKHGWFPTSPCGPDCLSGDEPKVGWFRAGWRLVQAIGVLFATLAVAPVVPIVGRRRRASLVRWFFRSMLRAFGVRLAVFGGYGWSRSPGGAPSWSTTHLLAGHRRRQRRPTDARPGEVRGSDLARARPAGHRGRHGLRGTATGFGCCPARFDELASVLRAGSMVNVTPEGTSWCGLASGRFHTAPFQAAIDANVPVIPVAFRFRLPDGRETTAPAFIGTRP